MIKIYIPYLLTVAQQIDTLQSLPIGDVKYEFVFQTLYNASSAIRVLHTSSVFAHYLRSSGPLSYELLGLIDAQTNNHDFQREIKFYESHQIKSKASEYKIALVAELGSFDSYFVTKKGAFDTWSLLNSGEIMFPPDLPRKVPEAVFDAREAAKCLAYEIPTAAGFHIFRATETVLRKYYSHETGCATQLKSRSVGVYLNMLKMANKGDPKVMGALKQLADLHRNPLIHPDTILTMHEAIALQGIAQSVITAILASLPEPAPTTSTPTLFDQQASVQRLG
jgi:hypothetical protein